MVRLRLPSIFAKINTARRVVNFFGYRAEFEQNFEQNKRFLRALPAGFYMAFAFSLKTAPSVTANHKPRNLRDVLTISKVTQFTAVCDVLREEANS